MTSTVAGFERVPVDSLAPHPANPRQGDVGAISDSLAHHGQYRPIVVQKSTSRVIAGNHTWKAAKALGWEQIEVAWVDVDDDEAMRILLVDNRTNDLASYDEPLLAEILGQVASSDGGFLGTGFAGDDLDELLEAVLPDPDGDERYTPEWIFEGMDSTFDIDLAGPPGGVPYIPAKRTLTKDEDALTHDWTGLFAWCNPPFSIASTFGRKWLEEVKEGVWLGPMSHATEYRVQLMQTAKAIWFPNELEFHLLGGEAEGIGFPVFMAGFGDRGNQALRNLKTNMPDRGILARIVKR